MRLMFLFGGLLGLLLVAILMCAPLIREAVDPTFDRTDEYVPHTGMGEFLHSIVHAFIDAPIEDRIVFFGCPSILLILFATSIYWQMIGDIDNRHMREKERRIRAENIAKYTKK